MGEDIEIMTAQEIHLHLYGLGRKAKAAWLAEHELNVYGVWSTFTETSVYRRLNSPLLLYVNFPEGEVSVPMDTQVQIRCKP